MDQDRMSEFDMDRDDRPDDERQDGAFDRAMPAGMPRVVPPPHVHPPVSMADIVQAAVNRAKHEYELDRLFNPEHYDHQI
jgi:hypothetical protein